MVEQIDAMRDIAHNITETHERKKRVTQDIPEFDQFRVTNQLLVGILAELRDIRNLQGGCQCSADGGRD